MTVIHYIDLIGEVANQIAKILMEIGPLSIAIWVLAFIYLDIERWG